MTPLHADVLRTLLYYDIWKHPLTRREVYAFLPVNSMTLAEFEARLNAEGIGNSLCETRDHLYVRGHGDEIVDDRRRKEETADRLWRRAHMSMHIIKRFPFVRGVFVSGDLSKNVATPQSDVDFLIVTAPGRLWIARTLLILFKKIVFLNSKKYFCLNYFVSEDHLRVDEENIFVATEIAHLKALYNEVLFGRYMTANRWIRKYFPNFSVTHLAMQQVNNRRSVLQRVAEVLMLVLPLSRIDEFLRQTMEKVWARRYPRVDAETRKRILRCTHYESRAYVGDFEERILAEYRERLRQFGLGG